MLTFHDVTLAKGMESPAWTNGPCPPLVGALVGRYRYHKNHFNGKAGGAEGGLEDFCSWRVLGDLLGSMATSADGTFREQQRGRLTQAGGIRPAGTWGARLHRMSYTNCAIALPASSVDALPPISGVRGPELESTNSIAASIASAASNSPKCLSIIAPDQI